MLQRIIAALLLVVVAVIVLMAATLFPDLHEAAIEIAIAGDGLAGWIDPIEAKATLTGDHHALVTGGWLNFAA